MDEIKILELVNRRRKSHAILSHTPCTKCGSFKHVLTNMLDRSCECERCYLERLRKEYMEEAHKPKLDLEDFARI